MKKLIKGFCDQFIELANKAYNDELKRLKDLKYKEKMLKISVSTKGKILKSDFVIQQWKNDYLKIVKDIPRWR
jgi:hypothetical protein